jgi:hypothetical protein
MHHTESRSTQSDDPRNDGTASQPTAFSSHGELDRPQVAQFRFVLPARDGRECSVAGASPLGRAELMCLAGGHRVCLWGVLH